MLTSRPARFAALALAATAALASIPGRAAAPDGPLQPLLDGCQRSDSLILAAATPEWAYVNANDVRNARLAGDAVAGRRSGEGVVTMSRPAGEDIYLDHNFHDYNVLMKPDPQYAGLLGAGNLAPSDEQNTIEGEWEVSQIPLWAWASAGDRVRLSGNWIWDCGHWGNSAADPTNLSQLLILDPIETLRNMISPGVLRGEATELHPMYEVATFRADQAARLLGHGVRRVSWLDVWINGNGTPAHSEEECALRGITSWVLARLACPSDRDVAGNYSYTMRLGPKPSAKSTIVVDPTVLRPETIPELRSIPVKLVPDTAKGTVTVSFTLPHAFVPQRYGLTVIAGWSDAPAAVLHEVRLSNIHIVRSLDGKSEPNLNPFGAPAEHTPDPGEWVLYANISGHWVQIPGITQVRDGQNVPIGITLRFYLPPGVTPTLYVSGHECDEPLMDCIHEGTSQQNDIFATTEAGFNDRPGRIQDNGFGVPMVFGTHVYRPPANPNPRVGNENLSDAVCGPLGCYALTATWSKP